MRQTPTTYVIGQVLRDIGLRQRGDDKDFSVKKLTIGGEVHHTFVVFYNRKAEALAWEFRQVIEEATRELGYPFTVRQLSEGHYSVSNR